MQIALCKWNYAIVAGPPTVYPATAVEMNPRWSKGAIIKENNIYYN